MDARDVDILLDDDVCRIKGGLGGGRVPGLPVPDVVGLLLTVDPNQRGVRLKRLLWIDHDRQRLIVDVHQPDRVGGDVALRSDDGGDFLSLVDDAVDGQDHLLVRHQGRHPGQASGVQVTAGDDGQHAWQRQGRLGVDIGDPGVGVRAADDIEVQHAGQFHVVDVGALAADEARVLLALDAVTHALDGSFGSHGLSPVPRSGFRVP